MTPDAQVIDLIKQRRKLESRLREQHIELAELNGRISVLTIELAEVTAKRDAIRLRLSAERRTP